MVRELLTGFKPLWSNDVIQQEAFEISTTCGKYTVVWGYELEPYEINGQQLIGKVYENTLKRYCLQNDIDDSYYKGMPVCGSKYVVKE